MPSFVIQMLSLLCIFVVMLALCATIVLFLIGGVCYKIYHIFQYIFVVNDEDILQQPIEELIITDEEMEIRLAIYADDTTDENYAIHVTHRMHVGGIAQLVKQ